LVLTVFVGTAELLTRTVSWFAGKGFTLALHELDAHDPAVNDIYQWHPFVGFTFRPDNVFAGGHPRQAKIAQHLVDSHGFLARDKGLLWGKDNGEIRIATIGGSTTANVNLSFDENWPGQLGALLQQALPGKTIRVINAGVPGFDTTQSIGNLALRVMPFNPDVVVIYHAYNDLKAIRPNIAYNPDYSHVHRRPYGFHKEPPWLIRLLNRNMFYVRMRNKYRQLQALSTPAGAKDEQQRLRAVPVLAARTFEQHLQALVAIAQAGGAKVVLSSYATLHDPQRDYSDRRVVGALSAMQKQELYGLAHFTTGLTLNGIFEGIKQYNEIIKVVAKRNNTGWVDNAALIPHETEYFVDRVHFTPRGAARMAENLLPAVLAQSRP
jgi:lysophospholipase L1-like esterase